MLAHAAGGATLPAPPWLLSYIGIALVVGTAAALRATWPRARQPLLEPVTPVAPRVGPGNVVGLAMYFGAVAVAIIGPDSSAANLAPWLVPVVWWVGVPIICLLLGDIVRPLNPFLPLVALVDRGRTRAARAMPSWTPAAFLAAWSWYLLAYHRPGSPRALALFLIAYALAAVAGGLRWGRAWLATGEAFGALSACIARVGLRGWRSSAPVAGTALLMLVWIGGTAFDGFTYQPFWQDVLGTSRGWTRTLLNSAGLLWIVAIVGGSFLAVVRVAERGQRAEDRERRLLDPLGRALVPLAVGWFLGHDLTFLLGEGQNAYALASDPLGRGWDLFGTLGHTIDYAIVTEPWVQWVQVLLIAAGHVVTMVLVHELAMQRLSARPAMRTTWAMAAVGSASITAAVLVVLA